MVCLLCCENTGDFIVLSSEQGKELKVPTLLFKYFRFVFENEPKDGEICQKCWIKIEMFHIFYIKIEAIQAEIVKDSIIVESLECNLKTDDDLIDDFKDQDTELCSNDDWLEAPSTSHEYLIPDVDNNQDDEESQTSNHKDDSQFEVERNDKSEPDRDKYYTKIKSRSNKLTYKCDLCKERFVKIVHLKKHLKDSHSLNFQCQFCDKILLNRRTLKTHIQSFHEPPKQQKRTVKRKTSTKLPKSEFKTIKCNICMEYFLTEAQLLKHQKLTHLALPFKCNHTQCKESFQTADLLEEHKTSAHVKVQCPHCPKNVAEHLLDLHIQRAHNKTFQTVCEQCGKIFPDNFARKYHIRMDHGNPDRVQCDMCKGFFKDKYNLQKHIKVVHLEGPAVCTECGKVTPNSKALKAHMLIHMQPNKECLICGKRFKHTSKLREHSYIHTGVTDAYECSFCGKKFRFGSSWSAHRMKYHPAEMAEAKQRLGKLKNIATQKMSAT